MGTDFSRVRFNQFLDHAGVELKQGAVLIDADFNEQTDIIDRRLRALASDVLGRERVSSTTPDAFKISVAAGMLMIDKGRLYVDGLLAENHGADPAAPVFDSLLGETQLGGAVRYDKQPYLPRPPALPASGRHLVYLEACNQEVTHLEAPALVEPAVGVEASSRIRTVWQVRVLEADAADKTCAAPDAELAGWPDVIAPSTGLLTTGTVNVAPTGDPCELPPTGGYRGLENQLYRVEIHDPGQPGGTATFKWSRDNGSVGSRVAGMNSLADLELETLGRDDVLSLETGDWVEINNDFRRFSRQPGVMRKITVFEATRRITFATNLPNDMDPGSFPDNSPAQQNMTVRRWDEKGKIFPTGSNVPVQDLDAALPPLGVIKVPASGTVLLLEHGVTVEFHATPGKGFRTGDYWVFAARTTDASVEELKRAAPRGIHRHFARLGIWKAPTTEVSDCRHQWPEGGDDCSCTACVTAESHASGQFTIQAAVDKVKKTGGTVCLGPGLYALAAPVRIEDAASIRVRGQGALSVIFTAGSAFILGDSFALGIENLAIYSLGGAPAIAVNNIFGLSLKQLVVAAATPNVDARGFEPRPGTAVALAGFVAGATIRENVFFASLGIRSDAAAEPTPAGLTPGGDRPPFLLVAALAIDDNFFWCGMRAVDLAGNVLHFLHARITGNEILACDEVAINAAGQGLDGSSITIAGNDVAIPGDGIRCSLDCWIEGNKLANTEGGGATAAIKLIRDPTGSDIGECQVLANQIRGFQIGISLDAPVGAGIVKLNIVDGCTFGIMSSGEGSVLSIENNQLRDVGRAGDSQNASIGIDAYLALSATISGNTIRSLRPLAANTKLCIGIYSASSQRARIIGNELLDIVPGEFGGHTIGIFVVTAPLTDFEVAHNRVERGISGQQGGGGGRWWALYIGPEADSLPVATPAAGVGPGTTATGTGTVGTASTASTQLNFRTLIDVLGTSNALVAPPVPVTPAPAAAPPGPKGSILGNVFLTRGITPAVEVMVDQCLFNDNLVERANVPGVATAHVVALSAPVMIVNANRVRGGLGGAASISITTAKDPPPNGVNRPAAVVGNITTDRILLFNGPLAAPWAPLNMMF